LLERVAGSNRSFTFTPKALYAMACYDWPGNIRELKNVLTDAVTRSTGSIRADHLSIANQPAPMNDATTGTSGFSREQIELVLDLRRQGKTEQAVRAALREEFGLQMSRAKYYRLLRQTGVSRDIARRRTIHDR
jgi:DNA-binding NtrC family response regulator